MGHACSKKPIGKDQNSKLRGLNAGYDSTQRLNIWEIIKDTKEIEKFLISSELNNLLQEKKSLREIVKGIHFTSVVQMFEIIFNIYNILPSEDKSAVTSEEYKLAKNGVCANIQKILQDDLVKLSKMDLTKLTNNELPAKLLELMVDTYQMLFFLRRYVDGPDEKKWWNVKQYGPKLDFMTSRFIEVDGKVKFELEMAAKQATQANNNNHHPDSATNDYPKRFSSSNSAKPLSQPPLSNLLNSGYASNDKKSSSEEDQSAYFNKFTEGYLKDLYQLSYVNYHKEMKSLINKIDYENDINEEEQVHKYNSTPLRVKA
jgi:hypothetical protein